MIGHIIFDLAGVCLQGHKSAIEQEISLLTGVSESEIGKHLMGDKVIRVFEGRATEDEYWQAVMEEGGYTLPLDVLRGIARQNFMEYPGTIAIIRKLKANRYPVALLSDHVKEWIEYIEEKFEFMKLFDRRFYSFNHQCTKLETRAFSNALFGMGAEPDKTLFIDDTADNLLIAQDAGIRYTHQFVSAAALGEYLLSKKVRLN